MNPHRKRAIEKAAKAIYECDAYTGPGKDTTWEKDTWGHMEFDRQQYRIMATAALDAAERMLPPRCPQCSHRSDLWEGDTCMTCAHLAQKHMDSYDFQEDLREYLDGVITHWRNIRDGYTSTDETTMQGIAVYYIDAYQSVRASMFGETLP